MGDRVRIELRPYGRNVDVERGTPLRDILYIYGVNSARFGLLSAWYDPLVEMWLDRLTPEEALAAIDANLDAVRAQRAAAGTPAFGR